MASVIATTDVWCEPNPTSSSRESYDPLGGGKVLALKPGCCPCDDCPKREHCRDNAMACQVFDEWVHPWRANRAVEIEARRIPGKAFLKDR